MFKMRAMLLPPGRRLLVGVLAVAVLLALPAAATSVSKIVIFGSHKGSTLRLHPRGHNKLVVKGNLAHHHPRGCHFTRGRRKAVCSLRGVGAIEVKMGPKGDKVKVTKSLPLPLVVHLGRGSDKFVGKGERDICFSEGSRRNRCIGGGNNDVCITGNRNSDCVGGGGNDFCHHGAGSDICIMGPGQDGCHGGPGNDRLYGGRAADQLYGGAGYDYCNGQRGWGRDHGCNTGPRR
jgi:hypothetical protein